MEANTVFGQVAFTEEEIQYISEILQEDLPIEEVSTRPGPANTTLSYLESWRAINLANKIFKFNGWSSSIKEVGPDFIEEVKIQGMTRYRVGVTAIVRITLKDGTFQEDVGYGSTENPSRGTAIENAKKEAVSDARKRALRLFGDGLGNSLYDKEANKSMGLLLKNKKSKPAAIAQTTTTPVQKPPQQQQPQQPQQQQQQQQTTITKPSIPVQTINKPSPQQQQPPPPFKPSTTSSSPPNVLNKNIQPPLNVTRPNIQPPNIQQQQQQPQQQIQPSDSYMDDQIYEPDFLN